MKLKVSFKGYKDLKNKQKDETRVSLVLNNDKGKRSSKRIKIWRQQDGFIYINNDIDVLYEMVDFVWHGAKFKTVLNSKTNTKNKGKSKRRGRFAGAIAGSILFPGVGTIIGALTGTGKKKKGKLKSTTIEEELEEEIDTPAIIKLKKKSTGEIKIINFQCNSTIADLLNTYMPQQDDMMENTKAHNPEDIYSEIKRFKALLDENIISPEEFEQKKKELLNI